MLETLLEFAVHDLGARGIGAILVYRADDRRRRSTIELRLPPPPPLDVRRPSNLAPLRHALAQIDGAAVIDADGILRELGVRLVPSPEAESSRRGLPRHAPHVGAPLQLRRPGGDRDRRQRGRPGHRAAQRRD